MFFRCQYCDKVYSILKFGRHIKTSQHRRRVAEIYGKNSTLVDLQMKQTAVRSASLLVGREGGEEGLSVEILPAPDEGQGARKCVYRQVLVHPLHIGHLDL